MSVWFSRDAPFLATVAAFVNHSRAGHFAEDLEQDLSVEEQDAVHQLVCRTSEM